MFNNTKKTRGNLESKEETRQVKGGLLYEKKGEH